MEEIVLTKRFNKKNPEQKTDKNYSSFGDISEKILLPLHEVCTKADENDIIYSYTKCKLPFTMAQHVHLIKEFTPNPK